MNHTPLHMISQLNFCWVCGLRVYTSGRRMGGVPAAECARVRRLFFTLTRIPHYRGGIKVCSGFSTSPVLKLYMDTSLKGQRI